MKKLRRLGSVQRGIMQLLDQVGAMSFVLLTSGKHAKTILRNYHQRSHERVISSLESLKRRRLINIADDGTETLITLTRDGKRELLRYGLNTMVLSRKQNWDGVWHMVIFDIPERYGKARRALSFKIQSIGAFRLQDSVYVYPFSWQNEIDFLSEFFHVSPFIRYIKASFVEGEEDLLRRFSLHKR
ncbi:MAG: hypothetical protein HYT39_00225 [Candidatus Sungbacteria bacterium]|nr:hypothetical protein [Candidatus Sungbacteria bacterium]